MEKEIVQIGEPVLRKKTKEVAISKITDAGILWFTDAPKLSVQILKSYYYSYSTGGDTNVIKHGWVIANWVLNHPATIQFLLFISLLLESCSFLLLTNKIIALVYGSLLLCMHIGIFIFMGINFISICMPMVIFCINPTYLLGAAGVAIKNRIWHQYARRK